MIQYPHADFSSFQIELESSSESVDGPTIEVMQVEKRNSGHRTDQKFGRGSPAAEKVAESAWKVATSRAVSMTTTPSLPDNVAVATLAPESADSVASP